MARTSDREELLDRATRAEIQSLRAELRIHRWLLGLLVLGLYVPMILDWLTSAG